MIPPPNKPKKLPGGQQYQGQDQGEGYLLGVRVAQYLCVSRRCPTWDQNSIFLLEIDPIPFLGLDLIDPRSSFLVIVVSKLSPIARH